MIKISTTSNETDDISPDPSTLWKTEEIMPIQLITGYTNSLNDTDYQHSLKKKQIIAWLAFHKPKKFNLYVVKKTTNAAKDVREKNPYSLLEAM